nr:MAG TPA: hypothetical protein [Caudoviricetes sp.]
MIVYCISTQNAHLLLIICFDINKEQLAYCKLLSFMFYGTCINYV